MSDQCFEFEKQFAKYQGRNEAVFFNSGSSANLAVLQSLINMGRLRRGDRVGFSALTWSTDVMPMIQLGLQPVPVDCEPNTLNSMPKNLLDCLKTTSLKAFFITNVLGFTSSLEKIKDICQKRKIILLEDNCESLGTELPGGKAGNFGLASTFSFYVAHHLSTIEGGMVTTNDVDLAEMLRIVRAHGWDRNLRPEQQSNWRKKYQIVDEFEAKYSFYDLGFNFRPTEINGFIGLYQLSYIEDIINKRESNFLRLEKAARKNKDLIFLDHSHIKRLSNFAFPVICKTKELKEKYLKKFQDAGVDARPIITGNIQRQPFFGKYVKRKYSLPGADFIHDNGFYFGNYPELKDSELEVLTECLRRV
ncbi:MAG: aminotransferase class I/II-fold pyridoxal phosphate-dependent enzyme [Patescibacteria group bacterium]|nr:aminotransferase class I/II-fold pyridoxal phosphate-dependent enzyme [Patescibacteria group bacterium]